MKPVTLLFSLMFVAIMALPAQINQASLEGTWYIVEQTDNSPFKLEEGAMLEEPPRTSSSPPKPKPEPFVERWTFDGRFVYIEQVSSMIQATTYELTTGHLQLNLTDPRQYELIYAMEDSLVLAVDRNEMIGGAYKDTLHLKKRAVEMPGFANIKSYVEQETLHDFQLHGVYQWVIAREKFADLSNVLEETEVLALSLRFYPDSTLMFMMSVIQKDARDADRCRECQVLNADVFPTPFGLHQLHKEGDTFYFQPEYTWVTEGYQSERKKIKKSDQIRFEIVLNEGTISLKTKPDFELLADPEQSFPFVPFWKMNYYIDQE